MNDPFLMRINWIYFSIKEQYQFINSMINQIKDNAYLLKAIEKEIYFYKTSLLLFKKSFSSFQEAYKKRSFDDLTINTIKELYLRRCLININKSYELLINNHFDFPNLFINDLIQKERILINSIKDLGSHLEKIK